MSEPDQCQRGDAPGFLLQRGTRLFSRMIDRALIPSGTQSADLPVLLALRRDGPALQRDLLRDAAVKQPAMVGIVRRLEKAGLVERRVWEDDGRATLIALTDRGIEVADRAVPILGAANARAFGDMSPDECAQAVAILHRMIANMTDHVDDIHQR